MDILKANRTDQRVPEWLREQMNNWNIKTVADLLKTDYAALCFLDIVTDEHLKDFVLFIHTYRLYDYVRLKDYSCKNDNQPKFNQNKKHELKQKKVNQLINEKGRTYSPLFLSLLVPLG